MAKTKSINEVDTASIKADLSNSQTIKRRNAAKKIGKLLLIDLDNDLFAAYEKEPKEKKNWETISEMIKALGRLRCKKLLHHVEKIVNSDLEFDIITSIAATAYVRLKSKNNDSFHLVLDLLQSHKYSVASGALEAIFYDEIKLDAEKIKLLVNIIDKYKHSNNSAYTDLRHTLICILSRYPANLIKPFIEKYRYLNTIQQPEVIDYALKGKAYYPNEY